MNLYRLNNGREVLGNALGSPLKYANRTQAAREVEALRAKGFAAVVYQPRVGPVFYIAFE